MIGLDSTWLGNSVLRWLGALALTAAVAGTLLVVKIVVRRRFAALARTMPTGLGDLVADLVDRTGTAFIIMVALYAGAAAVALPGRVDRLLTIAAAVALFLQGARWGDAVIAFAVTRQMQRRLERDAASATTIGVLSFVVRLAWWTVVLLLALDNFGVKVTTLVAGLGVGGIALALALQSVLGDVFAAFAIVLDKPFIIGDFIIVDDLLGTVEHIGLKTTRVRSLTGEQLIFSNRDLLDSRIRNYKRMYERRITFTFGVTYDTTLESLEVIPATLRRIVESQRATRFDRAHFKTYGDFSLVFEVVYYVLTPDYTTYMDIQQAINLELYQEFRARGIEFAFPTQTLYLRPPADSRLQHAGKSRLKTE